MLLVSRSRQRSCWKETSRVVPANTSSLRLDLSPALQEGRGCTVRVWMSQMPPKSWEFEPGVWLLLGVNFQVWAASTGGTEPIVATSALCAELHRLLVRGLNPGDSSQFCQ